MTDPLDPLDPTAPGRAATGPSYCDHCGEALSAQDHTRCRDLRELEPPRYCPFCRRRLVVQVVPRGWTARCSEHGLL